MKRSDSIDPFQIVRLGSPLEWGKIFSVDDINTQNRSGQNLLHEAIAYEKPQLALRLIECGIDLNRADHSGATPLHFAAERKLPAVTAAIVSNGGLVDREDGCGNQPLWTATFNARGDYEVVRILLGVGADPTHRNKSGRSPLDIAIQIQDKELELILRSGGAMASDSGID
jgi:uncharacterized protein